MAKAEQVVVGKALAAAMCPETDVAPPTRARSASLASAIADLAVGGDPASKATKLDPALTIEEITATKSQLSERLRNAVQSSVNQAKRRVPGAEFSIEINDLTTKSGMYLVALVSRNA